jgi:DNA-binding MarR family transcriptional regulator
MSSSSPGKEPRSRQRKAGAASGARNHAEVSALETHLGYWLRVVSNYVSHAFKTKVEQLGVTVAEWVVLRALFDGDGVKPSELAVTIGLTRGAISKLLDRLVAKDLVAVRGDARDGRAQVVTLRPSGRRLVPKLAALADENDAQAFGYLDRAQRAQLLSTLKGIVDHLGLRGAAVD